MNKTIIITGSTDGIGKLAAIKLAKDGHHVYIHGRNQEKLGKVIAEIKSLSSNENIDGFIADFSNLEAVKTMSDDIKNKLSKIDILINNAGVFQSAILKNKEGLDLRFVVNYLAPYLLTQQLIPLLEAGTNPRIINLSSAAQASVSMDALTGRTEISNQASYAQSKLALTMWSFHLAKTQAAIEVIPVNPGSLLNTRMVREAYGKFWSSADKGANILYDLAVSEQHKGKNGEYFDNDQGNYSKAHSDAYNTTIINELLESTKEIINL